MEKEIKLPPYDLHSTGYNIPYKLMYVCYHCNTFNKDQMIHMSNDEVKMYNENRNRLMHLTCPVCGKVCSFKGWEVLNAAGYLS